MLVKKCLPEIGEGREYVIHGAVNFYQELHLPAKKMCHPTCKIKKERKEKSYVSIKEKTKGKTQGLPLT